MRTKNRPYTSLLLGWLRSSYEKDPESGLYYAGARYHDSDLSMFLSVDRFAEKFPWQSPYCHAGNNPIGNIDVNGDSVWIANNTGFLGLGGKQYLLYENGNLYKDGHLFSGKPSNFIRKTVEALNTIRTSTEGLEMINTLQESTNSFRIHKSYKSFIDYGFVGSSNWIQAHCESINLVEGTNYKYVGASADIYWNPSGTPVRTQVGEVANPIADLAHEMAHAFFVNFGKEDLRGYNGLKRSEWNASYKENIIRGQLFMPYRTYYDTMTINGIVSYYLLKDNKPFKP